MCFSVIIGRRQLSRKHGRTRGHCDAASLWRFSEGGAANTDQGLLCGSGCKLGFRELCTVRILPASRPPLFTRRKLFIFLRLGIPSTPGTWYLNLTMTVWFSLLLH